VLVHREKFSVGEVRRGLLGPFHNPNHMASIGAHDWRPHFLSYFCVRSARPACNVHCRMRGGQAVPLYILARLRYRCRQCENFCAACTPCTFGTFIGLYLGTCIRKFSAIRSVLCARVHTPELGSKKAAWRIAKYARPLSRLCDSLGLSHAST